MGAPISQLGEARAFARDFPRDQMPKGYLWDIVDYVPAIIDASLTGRGGWIWASNAADGDIESGILATFTPGDQLLISTVTGSLYRVDEPSGGLTYVGATHRSKQNPVMLGEHAVVPAQSGTDVIHLWTTSGVIAAVTTHGYPRVATVYKSMAVTGDRPGEESTIRFSVPGKTLNDSASWDANSFYTTSARVSALAATRSAVLIFHAGSVERMRGSTPAHGATEQGDMFLEPLFDRVGCTQPKSIAYWSDNVIFADEHGVHLTDGAVIRNLATQGGISYFWRTMYGSMISVAGCVFLDYYICTIRLTSGPITLVCDLNRRQWFRFSNVDAMTIFGSSGTTGMERIWGGLGSNHNRLARLSAMFFPTIGASPIADGDGTIVNPVFETPWYRIAQEGRKRVRFVYLSYDVRAPGTTQSVEPAAWRDGDPAPFPPPAVAPQAAGDFLSVGYITTPQDLSYDPAGNLPATTGYTRYRLPINKFPYGLAFKVAQTQASTALRVFDLAVEAQAAERSRV